jgi:NusA-like KH domain protein
MRDFDIDMIRIITAFENMTGTEVRDCIKGETIYFLVNPGKVAMAIGKNGQAVKTAEKMLKRSIKIFEWSDNDLEFIKNMIPQAQKIEINEHSAIVSLESKDRGATIGKEGCNIKSIRVLLERNSNIKELKVL